MRHKKSLLIIAALAVVIALIQCTKALKEEDAMTHTGAGKG